MGDQDEMQTLAEYAWESVSKLVGTDEEGE
eukprot:COSAG06_NODE_61869_length_266_cov_1.053892_1_plen_29_part_10